MDSKYSGFGQVPPNSLQTPPSGQPFDPDAISKKIKRKLVGVFLILFLFGGIISSIFIMPNNFAGIMEVFDSGLIKGSMLDVAYVPDDENSGKVWVVTNPSFTYVETVETPGSYSVGSKCVGCKIRVYIYDPVGEIVIDSWDIEVNGLPPRVHLYYLDGKIWMSAIQTDHSDPFIYQYDAKTGEEILNTESFIAGHEEFSDVIIELRSSENPERYNLVLADGKEFIYVIDEEKVFDSLVKFNDYYKGSEEISIFTLTSESSDARTILYRVTGPKESVINGNCDSYADEADTLMFFCDSTAKKLSDKVFLEALIVYQDEQLAVVLHQDSIGRNARRLLTAIDNSGETLWSIPQEQLFSEVRYSPDDPFSDIFFIKSDISAQKSGGVFIFILNGPGAIGFDTLSGEQLWRVNI